MSKLIHLRQRISAIETIKKITHAMRLIAMSSHSQLRQSQIIVSHYRYELEAIVAELSAYAPDWRNPLFHPTPHGGKTAIIIIGSQKGLCGSFNNHLFKLATHELEKYNKNDLDIIAIGQKVLDFIAKNEYGEMRHSYAKFSAHRLFEIAHEIGHTITHMQPKYQSVLVISNEFKNFFLQKPMVTQLIPFARQSEQKKLDASDLLWEQEPTEVLNDLAPTYLIAQIQSLMLDSLLAEQAARFISMDSATRNADGLLDSTKLEYNKLRQAKITKELTELAASY